MNDDPALARVVLVQVMTDGSIVRHYMPVREAVYIAMFGLANGVTVRPAHVEFKDVLDRWGMSGAGARPGLPADTH